MKPISLALIAATLLYAATTISGLPTKNEDNNESKSANEGAPPATETRIPPNLNGIPDDLFRSVFSYSDSKDLSNFRCTSVSNRDCSERLMGYHPRYSNLGTKNQFMEQLNMNEINRDYKLYSMYVSHEVYQEIMALNPPLDFQYLQTLHIMVSHPNTAVRPVIYSMIRLFESITRNQPGTKDVAIYGPDGSTFNAYLYDRLVFNPSERATILSQVSALSKTILSEPWTNPRCKPLQCTVLIAAIAQTPNTQLIRELLGTGSITSTDLNNAILMAAATYQSDVALELLIEHGANTNVRDENGNTALMHATNREGRDRTFKILLDAGVDVNAINDKGETALMISGRNGREDTTFWLLKKGAEVNIQSKEGKTAMMMAAMKCDAYIVQTLLGKGADPRMQDQDGMTALDYAIAKQTNAKCQTIVELLQPLMN